MSAAAIAGLREIMSHEVLNGILPTQSHVKITDDRGEQLAVVTFMDAIEVLPVAAVYQ